MRQTSDKTPSFWPWAGICEMNPRLLCKLVTSGMPPRAIAGALKIIKRDYIKALKGEEEALHAMLPHVTATTCHPIMIRGRDWSTSTMRHLAKKAIRIALRTGKISSLNAAIAMEVLVDGVPVTEIATRCHVHRSNIYQHLTRARQHIPGIIDRLEVSLHEVI